MGEYSPRSFWYGPSEARSVQGRLSGIFSQYGPELVRVNKKFIIWLCLTLYYLKSAPWRTGMNETVYRESIQNSAVLLHTKNLYRTRKSKNFQRNWLFSFSFKSFQLFESNVRSYLLYSRFTSRALTLLIMPMRIMGKSGPEYWPITAHYIFTSSSHIII